MIIKVNTKMFEESLKKADLVRPGKPSLKILECVNLQALDNKVILTASDLDKQIDIIIDGCIIEESGEIAITNVKNLLKSFKYHKADYTELRTESNNIIITNSDKELEMVTQLEFPKALNINNQITKAYTYDIQKLNNRINKLKLFVAQDETRPILTGINFNNSDMVSLDGYRLGLNTDYELNVEKSFTVPLKALEIIQKSMTKTSKEITIKHDDKYIQFIFDNVIFTSRLIEGEFINYKQVIPEDYRTRIQINDKQLKELKENVEFLNSYIETSTHIKYKVKDNNILNTLSTQQGIYKTNTKCNIEGEGLEIAFNNKYIADVLKVIDKDTKNLTIDLKTPVSPAVIKCNDENELYLVLPVRLAA